MSETKICTKCGIEKPIAEFWISDKQRGYRRGPCKECDKAYQRKQYATNPEFRRKAKLNSSSWQKLNPRSSDDQWRYQIKSKFGLTPQQYDAMFEAQGRKCALCGAVNHGRDGKSGRYDGSRKWRPDSWPIDHDHKTGRVRGLLCQKCNVRLGAYEGLRDEVGFDRLHAYLGQ